MMQTILLGEIARCRFGDKGNNGMFVVVQYHARDYESLVAGVTPERVGDHFGKMPAEQITCIPCPQIGALVVFVRNSLRGGVTKSLAIDAHGKTLSGYLLGMAVPWNIK
ncbi:MAG: hypothetical protein HY868_26690 [Chloroflexi bacterium]|nr:hypothetical protein [Chloroflexota bacterium]